MLQAEKIGEKAHACRHNQRDNRNVQRIRQQKHRDGVDGEIAEETESLHAEIGSEFSYEASPAADKGKAAVEEPRGYDRAGKRRESGRDRVGVEPFRQDQQATAIESEADCANDRKS
nr:hypothetical protein [Fulvimarina manganoxydans]